MKPPFRHHNPLDNSCQSVDSEDIPYGSSNFSSGVYADLSTQSKGWLEIHYPELIFGFTFGKKCAKHDFATRVHGGWRWADWRTI